jgi:four helix bundle protein
LKITRFEDIEAWQCARQLANRIYSISETPEFTRDRSLQDQVRRAAVSVMANIAEGFHRESRKTLILYLGYSIGSVAEVKSHLYIATDRGYISDVERSECFVLADSVAKQLSGFSKYLRSTVAPSSGESHSEVTNVPKRTK